MSYVSSGLDAASIFLQLVVVLLLLLHFLRQYAILFLYCILHFTATVITAVIYWKYGRSSVAYRDLYWGSEVVLDLLLFLVVIILTYQALENNPLQKKIGRALGMVALGAIVFPFVVFRHDRLFGNLWFNRTSQMLMFGAAILNLGLWTALLSSKGKNRQLLTVSAGLGVWVTGLAISFGLREFFTFQGASIIDLFASAMHVLGVFIWCRAFWPALPRKAPQAAIGA